MTYFYTDIFGQRTAPPLSSPVPESLFVSSSTLGTLPNSSSGNYENTMMSSLSSSQVRSRLQAICLCLRVETPILQLVKMKK